MIAFIASETEIVICLKQLQIPLKKTKNSCGIEMKVVKNEKGVPCVQLFILALVYCLSNSVKLPMSSCLFTFLRFIEELWRNCSINRRDRTNVHLTNDFVNSGLCLPVSSWKCTLHQKPFGCKVHARFYSLSVFSRFIFTIMIMSKARKHLQIQ